MDRNSMEAVMKRMDGFLDILDAIPRAAHATYRSYKIEHLLAHSARSQASCIYDHMAEEAALKFDGVKGVKQIELRGLKLWLFEDHTVVRWKKMDEDGKSSNYPTQQAKDFDDMKQLDGLPAKPTRISVGYFLDPTNMRIERVQAARPNRRKVDWCAAIIPVEARVDGGRKWEEVSKQIRFTA